MLATAREQEKSQAAWAVRALFHAALCQIALLLLATAQVAYADEAKPFTIVYASDWSPYSYGLGSDADGILPRLMERIFSEIDGYELVHNGLPWERAQKVFFGGRADGMVATATKKRLQHAHKSREAALEIPFTPIVRRDSGFKDLLLKDTDLSDIRGARFCDVLGNGWAVEFYNARDIEFSVAPTIDNCLSQLKLGRVDIVIHARPVLEIFSRRMKLEEDLEILDLKYDESPAFPLMVSNAYGSAEDLIDRFDQAVSGMKRTGVIEDVMDELIEQEMERPAS